MKFQSFLSEIFHCLKEKNWKILEEQENTSLALH